MARICVDAGFLIGLYDPSDQFHEIATVQFESIFGEDSPRNVLAAPWPILYECLGTRFARDRRKLAAFNLLWEGLERAQAVLLLDDRPFREAQLIELLQDPTRNLSLVDRVVRAMACSEDRPFDALLTYNTADFADICSGNGITLIDENSTPESYGF